METLVLCIETHARPDRGVRIHKTLIWRCGVLGAWCTTVLNGGDDEWW